MPVATWNTANMPLSQNVPLQPESLGKPGFAAQSDDKGRVCFHALSHADHNLGKLPQRQESYLPNAEKPPVWHLSPSVEGERVGRTKRPQAYSVVQVEIGKRIRWARQLVEPNGVTFARLLGVDPSTLAKIEAGDRPPSIFNVLDIAHKLRVSTDYILTGSLRGVDGELAGLLVADHPELLRDRHMGTDYDRSPQPRTLKRA